VPFSGFWSKDAIIGAVHDKIHTLDHEIEHRADERPSTHATHPAVGENAVAQTTASLPPLASLSAAELTRFRTVYSLLYYSALFTAFLTAFYTFRALCMTFYGEEKIPHQAGHHAHESPGVMVAPLVVLAICAVGVGMVFTHDILAAFLGGTPSLAAGPIVLTGVHPEFHLSVAGTSTVVALAGIILAMYLYLGHRSEVVELQQAFDLQGAQKLTDLAWIPRLEQVWWIGAVTRSLRQIGFGWLVSLVGYLIGIVALVLAIPLMLARFFTPYKLSYGKFYLDELYHWVAVRPLEILSAVLAWIDDWILDGLVNLIGRIPPAAGSLMRSLQMGLVQFYALAMVLGALILIAAKMLWAAG
jgi:NADH-quinone oxidoreductase subunit L